jgi:hypothetical protein
MEERRTNGIERVARAVWALCIVMLCVPCLAAAQESAAPSPASSGSREIPRPDQLEPGVSTTPTAPAAPAASPVTPAAPAPAPSPVTPAAPAPAPSPAAPAAPARAASPAAPPAAATPATPSPQTAPAATPAASAAPSAAKAGARKGPDRLELDTTDITGNRELPKVLYIVPWKRSDLGDVVGRPVNSLLDEVLQPLDRDVFRRENRYYDALQPGAGDAKAGTAQGSQPKP